MGRYCCATHIIKNTCYGGRNQLSLNKLIEEAINHESELKTHKRDELAYQAKLEGLHADLKSASKTTARKSRTCLANEFVDLIMEAEDNAPPPPVMRRYLTNDATIEKLGELERDNPNGILLMAVGYDVYRGPFTSNLRMSSGSNIRSFESCSWVVLLLVARDNRRITPKSY